MLKPDWPAPAGVIAVSTTRGGGVSEGAWAGFNLAEHVGDDPEAVAANRERLLASCPGLHDICWLQQEHGVAVREAGAYEEPPVADAVITREAGIGCAVLTADCLPVLLCDREGREVAAAHAGWRGLAAGVLERTIAAFKTPPAQLLAWLGPAIGPARFEVGPEVREQFLAAADRADRSATEAAFRRGHRAGHYLADLYELARLRLWAAGVTDVHGGGWCTFADSARFYSYRRDGVTGRMATLIYRAP